MGSRSRTDSSGDFCGDAHRLVETLAGLGENGKQRCERCGALSGLEFVGAELYEERKITASGHETTDTDPGIATTKDDYSLETYILSTNNYQIELLMNLDQVPESGAVVVVSFPKPKGGSGFPARVFAILP